MYKDQLPEPKSRYQFYNFSCHRYSYNTCLYIFPDLLYFVLISKAWSEEWVLPSVTHGIQVPMNALHSHDECPLLKATTDHLHLHRLPTGQAAQSSRNFLAALHFKLFSICSLTGFVVLACSILVPVALYLFAIAFCLPWKEADGIFPALRSDSLPASRSRSP